MHDQTDYLIDILTHLLSTIRTECVVHHAWIVDAHALAIAACESTTTRLGAPQRAALRADASLPPDSGPTQIIHDGRLMAVQRLDGRYRSLALLLEAPPTGVLDVAALAAATRRIGRAISGWLPPRDQDRLRRRAVSGELVGDTFARLSRSIEHLELIDNTGLTTRSWTPDTLEIDGGRAASELRSADRCAAVAAFGPLAELTWLDGQRARITMRIGESEGALVLDLADATELEPLQALIDLLLPNRHLRPGRAWLRDHGCDDPQRTTWRPQPAARANHRLVCSRHGRLFHRPSCTRIDNVAASNRRWLTSRIAGLTRGLRPCKACGS